MFLKADESQDSDSQDSDSYSNDYSELTQNSESDDYDYTGSSDMKLNDN